jgi:hypothetical protein
MALKSTITAETPDKVETKHDRTVANRGYWDYDAETDVFTFVNQGAFIRTDVHTTKTWFACSKSACDSFIAAYTGTGSFSAEEVSEVLHAYNFVLTETTQTEEWVDYVPPEE